MRYPRVFTKENSLALFSQQAWANRSGDPDQGDRERQHESVFMMISCPETEVSIGAKGEEKLKPAAISWWNTGNQKWREWLHFPSWQYSVKAIKVTLCLHQTPEFLELRLKRSSQLQSTMAGSPQQGELSGTGGMSSQIQYVLKVHLKKKRKESVISPPLIYFMFWRSAYNFLSVETVDIMYFICFFFF